MGNDSIDSVLMQNLGCGHMGEVTRERLLKQATAFRDAIERVERARLGITFDSFPRGSCGDASLVLGHFLKKRGFVCPTYVQGERGEVNDDWTSHAWLRVDRFIVDITADQFPEIGERAIVAEESTWHGTFEIIAESEGDFTIYDDRTIANLSRIYAAITAHLV
jgi:hypothetical protein